MWAPLQSEKGTPQLFSRIFPRGNFSLQGQNLALTVSLVPNALDLGFENTSGHVRQSRPDSGLDLVCSG